MESAMRGEGLSWGWGARVASGLRRHRHMAASGLLLAALAAPAFLPGFRDARPGAIVAPYPHELAQVSFAVAGDVIPHEPVRAAAAAAVNADPGNAQGWGALFSD